MVVRPKHVAVKCVISSTTYCNKRCVDGKCLALMYVFSSLHTPQDVFAYPRLQTAGLEDVGASTSHSPTSLAASDRHRFTCVR
jgi:hypothetical protein